MSNDDVTSQALYIQNCSGKEMEKFRKGNGEEVMDFQPRCINVKRRCRSDVLWQIALDTSSDDREGSIDDSGESSSADNQ